MSSLETELSSLRQLISAIQEKGDSRLPPEPKLAEQLGVSRGRLRTLLKKVEEEGLIWRHVGKGTFVGPRKLDVDLSQWTEGVSVMESMGARLTFEPGMAVQAALHAKPADISAMGRCLDAMKQSQSYLDWKRHDAEFHAAIAKATHNSLVELLYELLNEQVSKVLEGRLKNIYVNRLPDEKTYHQHEAILQAIASHDPDEASRVMREHLVDVRTSLFGLEGG